MCQAQFRDDRVSVGEIASQSVGWHDMEELKARLTILLGVEAELTRLRRPLHYGTLE